MYVECMRQAGHVEAGSRWYRTFQTREILSWIRGEFDDARVDVPVRWLTGHSRSGDYTRILMTDMLTA